ncbi:MAG: N-acetylglucosaminyldiphosphoundecaprenol N-acetyl-beta-D-mannosaminyltransferase [Verrucomicrobiales bacterium]|jgi:N-acetylglucosaminyldiphosphoundecaprenol N-acetyl-beta-D-mannosaminyltransferase
MTTDQKMQEKTQEWKREPYVISTLLGIPFHHVTMAQTLETCERLLDDRSEPSYIVTANVDFTYLASKNPALRDFIFHSDLVICDGLPLVGLSKVCGGAELPERVAGSDLGMPLLELCARRGFSVYFLGSDEQTLGELEDVLAERLPELKIAGHCSPPIGQVEDWDNEELSEKIENAAPHLILAAFGCPKQEQWIARNHRSLGVPLSIGVGATLDFIVGKQQRAPKLAQKLCLEWFWRMCSNPKRFVKRYAKDFGFLSEAAVRQWLDSRKRGKVIDGVDPDVAKAHRYTVCGGAWKSGGLAGCEELASDRGDVLIDCSTVTRFGAVELGQLCEMARQVHRSSRYFAIVRPTEVVSSMIKHQKLDAQLPMFESLKASLLDNVAAPHIAKTEFEGWTKNWSRDSKEGVEIT